MYFDTTKFHINDILSHSLSGCQTFPVNYFQFVRQCSYFSTESWVSGLLLIHLLSFCTSKMSRLTRTMFYYAQVLCLLCRPHWKSTSQNCFLFQTIESDACFAALLDKTNKQDLHLLSMEYLVFPNIQGFLKRSFAGLHNLPNVP